MAEPDGSGPRSTTRGGLAALGIAAFAVVCCAALPLLAAIAGGAALGAVLGIGAGVVAAGLLVGLVVVRIRRRACVRPAPSPLADDDDGASARARARKPSAG